MNNGKTVSYEISLAITNDQMRRYYDGSASVVVTRTRCGSTLQLAARHLRPFLDHNGVHGVFLLTLSADNRLLDLVRIG